MSSVLGGAGLRVAIALALGLSLGAATMPACSVTSIFTCADDESCIAEAGVGAVCDLETNYCQVPNPGCTVSGFEWYERSSDDLAGQCLEDTLGGTGGTGMVATSTGDSSTGGGSDTTPPGDSSDDGTPPGDSSDDGVMTTDPGTDSGDTGMMGSTGAAGMCDAVFGGIADYMLCEETPTECTFNATVNMMGCESACASVGATCVGAQTNDMTGCTASGDTTCDDLTFGDGICTCALP